LSVPTRRSSDLFTLFPVGPEVVSKIPALVQCLTHDVKGQAPLHDLVVELVKHTLQRLIDHEVHLAAHLVAVQERVVHVLHVSPPQERTRWPSPGTAVPCEDPA